MRQIILASQSKARAGLLRECGFKIKIKAPDINEVKYSNSRSIKKLVMHNALLKARATVYLFKSGVVIAADTVVLQDKKIFGKPKDKKEAFITIKKLSHKPSCVYTGIAVIDIDNGRIYTNYEKTKVWMSKLSDSQIKKYLSCANIEHSSFAGGFNIQGKGGLFIERIEGCFYNVVGLPLARLYHLLKKCKVDI